MTGIIKKAAMAIIITITMATVANAQYYTKKGQGDDKFVKGSTVLNVGIGFGSTIYGSGYGMQLPPLSASLEIGVADNLFGNGKGAFGVAPYAGFATYLYSGTNVTSMNFGMRGNLHYPFTDNLDAYTGLAMGYRMVKWGHDFSGGGLIGNGVDLGWIIGGRYYFNNNIAGMLELGYGISYINLGVAFKF